MRKLRNEKGFAMAELLAVCIVLLGLFAVLFSNYLPLTAEYDNKVTYNNINAEYAGTYMRKAFKDVKVYSNLGANTIKRLDDENYGYVTLYQCKDLTSCDTTTLEKVLGEGSSQYKTVKKLIDEYGVQEMILTRYKTDIVKEKYSEGGLLYNYIQQLPTYNDYKVTKTGKYRLIFKTKDYGYATVPLRYALSNGPILKNGMIPVYYENGNWIVADQSNESVTHGWYDYAEKKWANAVKLSSGSNCSTSMGSDVTKCIESMWVWIPRYKYSKINSTSTKRISVTFLTPENTKDTAHPAFKEDAENGFWVGKYESNGNIIKSGLTVNSSSSLQAAEKSSIITNQEWGAVAYLAYSKYGSCTDNDCNVTRNDTLKTGGGGLTASTTNNNYGVFDMNGGKYEFVNGYSTRGDGTATDEVSAEIRTKHTFDHYFLCEECDGWCETISHYHPCSYNCGTAEEPKYCSCSYYTYSYTWHQDRDVIQKTDSPWEKTGGSGTNCAPITKNALAPKTATGYTTHSWQSDMRTNEGGCDGKLDLRGGAYDGNAWCIKNEVANTSTASTTTTAKNDTDMYHYDVKSLSNTASYSGIFAYSSSSYVKSDYIATRSVLK